MIDVSVVIPTYNRKDYLNNAIKSCFNKNGNIDVEVIVVDDGSTDGTPSFLERLSDERIRPIFQSSQGAQVARNAGKNASTGRYIKFLDDDDWLMEGALTREVNALDDSKCDYSYGNIVFQTGKQKWRFEQSTNTDGAAGIFRESIWTHPLTFLYRSELVQEIDWDVSLPFHQDYAFALEAATKSLSALHVNSNVGIVREHSGERIQDKKKKTPISEYYETKVSIITQGISLLRERGLIEPYHRQAAAEGIWNWAHIIAGYDIELFKQFYSDIQDIAPGFQPDRRRRMFRVMDALLGASGTERLLYPLRRMKNMMLQPRR